MYRTARLLPPIAILAVLLIAADKPVQTLAGKVIRISDGDTIAVLDIDRQEHKIRLLGIDAPEKSQAFGNRSKQMLAELVEGKQVRIAWRERDRYSRILGDVYVQGNRVEEVWVNLAMVESGLAWHYRQYDRREILETAEVDAREAGRGLWAERKPAPPWEFRKSEKERRAKNKAGAD